jgi:diketogulonate reductase-like aldo/keto reductase
MWAERLTHSGADLLAKLPDPLPAVNQIELHPWCQQRKTVDYCQKKGIVIQAYCPIVRADQKKFNDPVIKQLCAKHNKDPAQILIRWSLQKGYVECLSHASWSDRIKLTSQIRPLTQKRSATADRIQCQCLRL